MNQTLDDLITIALNPWDMTVQDSNAIVVQLRRLVEVEQELARIKGARLPENLAVIEQALTIWRHAEASPMCDKRGLPGAQIMDWLKDMLDTVRVLTAELDDLRRRPAESRALRAESERDKARAEVERLKAQLISSEDNARQQKALADMAIATSERRTQETIAAEERARARAFICERCEDEEQHGDTMNELRAQVERLNERLCTMQHGEAEALKMMAAEKQRADRLAELVMGANPIGWAGAGQLDAADAWQKKAERLLNEVPR